MINQFHRYMLIQTNKWNGKSFDYGTEIIDTQDGKRYMTCDFDSKPTLWGTSYAARPKVLKTSDNKKDLGL